MKIAFLTSGHFPLDDRIFWHFGVTLAGEGHSVQIISSRTDLETTREGIIINSFDGSGMKKKERLNRFFQALSGYGPAVVICSEPLPVIAAYRYKKRKEPKARIICDITEFYPSEKLFSHRTLLSAMFAFLSQSALNLYSSALADGFIFGEWHKSKFYRRLFPFRKFEYITYYPSLFYVSFKEPSAIGNKLTLSYSGPISKAKGFINFIRVAGKLAELRPGINIELRIAGWYENEEDRKECSGHFNDLPVNINVILKLRMELPEYLKFISECDVFTDLREISSETTKCLPIRLFWFTALGKPVIFSGLSAIRDAVDINKFGYLVNPDDTEKTVSLISDYLNDKKLYLGHCANARSLAVEKYNWDRIKGRFLKFVTSDVV